MKWLQDRWRIAAAENGGLTSARYSDRRAVSTASLRGRRLLEMWMNLVVQLPMRSGAQFCRGSACMGQSDFAHSARGGLVAAQSPTQDEAASDYHPWR